MGDKATVSKVSKRSGKPSELIFALRINTRTSDAVLKWVPKLH